MAGEVSTIQKTNIGDFIQLGRYSLLVALLYEFMTFSQVGGMLYMVFAGAAPALKSCGDHDLSSFIHTREACKELSSIRSNTTESCEVELGYQFASVNVEWNYYCENAHKVKHSISVQMIGLMVGAATFGHISDTYGRRVAMLISLFGCMISTLASGFAPDLWTFTALRFIVNIFSGGQTS
ncbi:hypothetical protein FO519_006410 [Halicephalobus sp. NKZ332]|nr:hypothetical protein FO519_006410 [Halicephalobus sp. NKZ332]